jgi:RNA polymerase sigma-70 factor (ECF subfamily)
MTLTATEAPDEDGDHERSARRVPGVAEPRRPGRSAAEPQQTEHDRTEPQRTELQRTGRQLTEPQRTERNPGEPRQTEQDLTQPRRTGRELPRRTGQNPAEAQQTEQDPTQPRRTGRELPRRPEQNPAEPRRAEQNLTEPRREVAVAEGDSGRGDSVEGSFAGFYREAYPRLAGRAIARGLSRDDAADAAQEALVGVYKRWAMLHPQPPECRFRYASAALENAVQNAWRRRGRDADLSERLSSSERVGSFVRFDADDGDTDALDLLRSLPERQRAVVLLLDEGWTPNEIAVRLRIGATSVRTHLQHARKTLRAKLQARKEGDRG